MQAGKFLSVSKCIALLLVAYLCVFARGFILVFAAWPLGLDKIQYGQRTVTEKAYLSASDKELAQRGEQFRICFLFQLKPIYESFLLHKKR